MDKEKIKEDLSICYLKTIAAVNGIALERIEHDEDSVDVVMQCEHVALSTDYWT